jgi:hypothetical protein
MSVNSEHNYIRKLTELHQRGVIPEGRAGCCPTRTRHRGANEKGRGVS